MSVDVAVVGAGLAGLSCALRLGELGLSCQVLEGADAVGGRLRSDRGNGFVLDRGFQVLLDSYPEVRARLDLGALRTGAFEPGALVRRGGGFWRVTDPWRRPWLALSTMRAPFVSWGDAWRMLGLRADALRAPLEAPDVGMGAYLAQRGFSEPMRNAFFGPFFRGVTLDPALERPASFFLQLFGWFARGSAVLPARGMQAIPEQLAERLAADQLRLAAPVGELREGALVLEDGERIECGAQVLATEPDAARRLLGAPADAEWLSTTTIYYAAERSPVGEPILVLHGEDRDEGPVHHLCVLSDAQPSYAPAGAALVSVSLLGVPGASDAELDSAARAQLEGWYGAEVRGWELLRVDRVRRALPQRCIGADMPSPRQGVHLCGDYTRTPSIQGALESGRRAAEAVAAELGALEPALAR